VQLGISGHGLLTATPTGDVVFNETDCAHWISGRSYTLGVGGEIVFALNGVRSVEGNTLKLYYVRDSGGGTFKIQSKVEGGSWTDETGYTSVSTGGEEAGIVVTITKTEYRKFWQFKVVGLTGTCRIIGGGIRDTQQGGALVTIMPNSSNGANEIDDSLTTPAAILNPIIRDLAPNLIVHSNLDGAAINTSSLSSYLDKLIDAAESSSGITPSTIIVGPTLGWDSTQDALTAAQSAVMRGIAKTRGDAFWENRTWAMPISNALSKGYIIADNVHYQSPAHQQWVPAMLHHFGIGKTSTGLAATPYLRFPQGNNNIGPTLLRIDKNSYVAGNQSLEVLGSLRIVNNPGIGGTPTGGHLATLILEDRAGSASSANAYSIYHSSADLWITMPGGYSFRMDPGTGSYRLWASEATAGAPIGDLGTLASPWKTLYLGKSEASATGDRTASLSHGTVKFAAASGTPIVVTNALVNATSNILVQVYGTDATLTSCRVTRAAGSFTITPNAAATAETTVGWFVLP
jgi:hypothetical protein